MVARYGLLVCLLGVSLAGLVQAALPDLTPDAQADQIFNLTGLNYKIPFRQFSGYLDAGDNNSFHYWFVESYVNPSTAPLMLWMNGGPGCSSLDGLLSELGPFRVQEDGKTLSNNSYSWNTFAGIIFLESPSCVGYSYNKNKNCNSSDDLTALHHYNALKSFYTKFPSYKSNDFFVVAESYGGMFAATLAVRIIENNSTYPINLQGFAVGNGLLSWPDNLNGLMFFANYHGLFGNYLWEGLIGECCDFASPTKKDCEFYRPRWPLCEAWIIRACNVLNTKYLNNYDLYAPCYYPNKTTRNQGLSRYHADLRAVNFFRQRTGELPALKEANLPCIDSTAMTTYLNLASVRKDLHIPDSLPAWEICNDYVSMHYDKQYTTVAEQFKKIQAAGIRGLLYNGDTDMISNFISTEYFVEDLKYLGVSTRRAWHSGGQIAGFATRYELLDLLTVLGSGHMVPTNKPGPALDMIKAFVFNTGYD